MLSPPLFLVLIDCVKRIANEGSRRAYSGEFLPESWNIRMTLTTPMIWLSGHALKLRFEIRPICYGRLLSDMEFAEKESDVNTTLDASLTVASETLECGDSFTYLESLISRAGSAQKYIKNRLCKVRNAFANLRLVWRSSIYSILTKLNLYNSIVKSVLMYGSECWQVIETRHNEKIPS